MKKIFLLVFFLIFTLCTFSQTELYTKVEANFLFISSNFKKYLPLKESKSFESFIESFNTNVSSYLNGGYGLTFEELNKVRVMKKFSTAFENFYSALRYDCNKTFCCMKDIRLVMEYFPEINMVISKYYQDSLMVYKIEVDRFCVFFARHDDKNSSKTIYYSAKLGNSTQSGNMGLPYNCVRKIIDNVDFGYSKYVTPIITKQENINSFSNTNSFCGAE